MSTELWLPLGFALTLTTMTKLPRSAPAIAVIAAIALTAGTGGAVASHLITSSDIQDGTIRSVDVQNGTLTNADLSAATKASLQGISGYQILQASKPVAANTATNIALVCPTGKKMLSGSGHWKLSNEAVQFVLGGSGSDGTSYTSGIPTNDTLAITIICAVV